MADLSERARAICKEHWYPERTRCKGCPLLAPCSAPVAPMTLANIDARTEAMNAATEVVDSAKLDRPKNGADQPRQGSLFDA